jgi:predicted phage-related endonuclease
MTITRETLAYTTEAQWLEARKLDVTSTEAASLFNAGAYIKTVYELYHLKAGLLPEQDFIGNERTRWGNRLEDAIARGVAEDLGLVVEPFKVYMRLPEVRMGSSFDFKVVGLVDGAEENAAREMFRDHGPGVLEVKNVDGLQFKRGWLDDGENIEAPVHIEFQVQHQLEVADLGWAIIAPLVGGNTPKPILRLRDHAVGAEIRARVADVWARIARQDAPAPDFTKDGDTIAQVYRDNDGSAVDLSGNFRLGELCRAYKKAGEAEKAAKEAKDAAKAEILTIVQHAKSITAPGFNISAGTNKESFRAYCRNESERISISLTKIPGTNIEATVAPFRAVRITEAA